ncbi:MAG: FlgD immunoglobulin-like domain containing protein, partial [candidate division WOR-3 bacterium]
EMLDLQFYRYHLSGDGFQFGVLNALSKDYFQSLTMGQEVWRWCVYELNLFGDPSLGMWSEKPATLQVSAPVSVPTGAQTMRVTVTRTGSPVAGALVCARKSGETYARAWTNSAGWVDLLVNPTTTGSLELSVSARNCYPSERQITVSGSSTQPALVFGRLRIDDTDGNGRLDPGETADLYVSIVNGGAAAATGVTARLRTSCPYLSLLDSTSNYGTVNPADTVEGDRFRVSASSSTPSGTLAELVTFCTSPQGNWEPYCQTRIGELPPPRKLWADHDTGNMILSVTTVGSIGTLGPYREGSGLKYPRDAGYGSLYFTSLACGNSPSYVVDRWYGQPTSTFQTDWRAVDTLHAVRPPIGAHEEYQCVIDDAAHPNPKGLRVTQWSGALADSAYRDFVIITYNVENTGSAPINGLYVGIFSDFDVNNTTSNNVYTDAGRRLTYMTQSSSYTNSAGIKLLSPTVAANLSAIDHAVYVTPGNMMTEAVKDSFLRGAISRPNSNGARNWSCVVSAGPFDLAPGARTRVAFALVGGNTQQEMLNHADSAQSWYDHQMPRGLTFLKATIDDGAGGNGDGIINPGERINLPTWVVNRSDRGTAGVWGILRKTSADTLVTVTDSVRRFGTVAGGDSAYTGPDGFKFRVAAACTNRFALPLVLVCVDTLDSVYTSSLPLVVGAPQLVPGGIQCWDPLPGGNNNGRLDPGEEADIALGIQNIGLGHAENVAARLRSTDSRLLVLDSLGTYGNVRRDSTVFNTQDRYRVRASSSIPPETQIPCTLVVSGTGYQAKRLVLVAVGALTAIDPIPDGPRVPPRYYAYDDVDSSYVSCPEFNWVEIRDLGTRLVLSDDQTVVQNLPPGFGLWRYYGVNYSQISICGNGWVAPGSTTSSVYSNTALPGGPVPQMVALNWDDLYPPTGGGVWYYHDTTGHRFVVEWDSVAYYSQRTVFDKFQIVIYDSTVHSATGDNIFDIQYLTANNYVSNTVGLQDQTMAIGIQCLFNGAYHRAAAPIVPGRCIRLTTDSVQTGANELTGVQGRLWLALAAWPNPVSRAAQVSFTLPQDSRVRLSVVDATGRLVRTLAEGEFVRGPHTAVWDGKDSQGQRVANGIYLYRIETNAGTRQHKAVVLR